MVRWLPITASVALTVLIVVVSITTVADLKKTTSKREHAFQEILEAQTIEDKLLDAQKSIHGYARRGEANLLLEYKSDTNIDLQDVNDLAKLASDDPEQQARLQDLAEAVKAVFAYDNKVIGLYARQGSNAAMAMDDAEEGRDNADRAIADLEAFADKEKKLLTQEDAAEQTGVHHAADLLICGSVAVALLLVLVNYVASREMARRRKAEAEQRELIARLQTALTEVKTLSGLIPICGWCKSVRSDEGFWESVEHYVRARTDASFTHGVCPSCTARLKAEIVKANPQSN